MNFYFTVSSVGQASSGLSWFPAPLSQRRNQDVGRAFKHHFNDYIILHQIIALWFTKKQSNSFFIRINNCTNAKVVRDHFPMKECTLIFYPNNSSHQMFCYFFLLLIFLANILTYPY